MVKEKTLSLDDLENFRWEKASKKDLEMLIFTGRRSERQSETVQLCFCFTWMKKLISKLLRSILFMES
jgi:hypothetical protein